MATVELKHLHIVTSKGKTYVYAWRGGPRIVTEADVGTPAFFAVYQETISAHRIPDLKKFHSVIVRYRSSPDFERLADSTKRNWRPWLDRIDEHFGDLRTRAFDKGDSAKKAIRKWRGQYSATPRTADYGLQVLSRVLAYAVDPLGEVGTNPCEGVKQVYSNSRADIIWTDADIEKVRVHCSDEVAWAVDLAAHTGLRAGDLVKLSWSHVSADAIIMRTGKSRGRKEAIVPLYPELRALLERIPKRSTAILTSSLKRPWNKDGLSGRFAEAKNKAWPEDTDLNFNDLRGTAATKFYIAGFTIREIAEMMGWEEESVDKIIRRYVSLTAALQDRIKRLSKARDGV
jgi:integrase